MLEIKQTPSGQVTGRLHKARPVLRKIRKGIVIVLFLTGIIVGAATIYVWLNKGSAAEPTAVVANIEPKEVKKPRGPSPTAPIGVSVQYITTPVKIGDQWKMSVHTNANANCDIDVEYELDKIEHKTISSDNGLVPQRADEYGLASWTWKVKAPRGNTRATVTCANQKNWAVVSGDFVVK